MAFPGWPDSRQGQKRLFQRIRIPGRGSMGLFQRSRISGWGKLGVSMVAAGRIPGMGLHGNAVRRSLRSTHKRQMFWWTPFCRSHNKGDSSPFNTSGRLPGGRMDKPLVAPAQNIRFPWPGSDRHFSATARVSVRRTRRLPSHFLLPLLPLNCPHRTTDFSPSLESQPSEHVEKVS